jgi:peptidoglycan-N-acetylglucosamine deacetylase
MLEGIFGVILVFSWVLLGLMLFKIVMFVSLSSRHHTHYKRRHAAELAATPLVSILVPCYNEGKVLDNCVKSLIEQDYPNFEIIIINDGSTDDSLEVARRLAKKHRPIIHVSDKKNGGKASALNRGIERARGEIVVCIDADSMFLKDTVRQLVLSFEDNAVAAVGGNVRVANRGKVLGRQQGLEYITGLTVQRKAFAHLGCMQVISGAIGAFKRDALRGVGGYSTDTIVEDMDLTIELIKNGYKVVYNPRAIAYTEAPENLKDFQKQRYRWTYGNFQVISKHRDALWCRDASRAGFIGIPYCLIFPWVDVLVSISVFAALFRVMVTGDAVTFLLAYLAMAMLQAGIIVYALIMDKEDKRLVMMVIVDTLLYSHLLNYTTLRAGVNFVRKKKTTWNKLERYGKNILPVART